MSLYFEAAKILEGIQESPVSLKDRVFKDKTLKAPPVTIFALVSEAIKWSEILSEVVDKSQILSLERKLTPSLSLVLAHDLLVSKNGLALSKKHALYGIITKHRARLTSELTRSRIKRSLTSLDALRTQVNASPTYYGTDPIPFHPRWVRINTILTTPETLLATHLANLHTVSSLSALATSPHGIYMDPHITHLIALHPSRDMTKTVAYKQGHIILQDKASCFPAFLLDPTPATGRVIDGCAAPGNKTTHLAAMLHERNVTSEGAKPVVACERSMARAEVLRGMVHKAGGDDSIEVRAGQDFLALKPQDAAWADVGGILLDPSCSGSGIVGRDDGATAGRKVYFPAAAAAAAAGPKAIGANKRDEAGKGKKRKRGRNEAEEADDDYDDADDTTAHPVIPEAEEVDAQYTQVVEGEKLKDRLRALSAFQLKLLTHAFRFPAATRVTYSTCSVHAEENEAVVIGALTSQIARERGWRIMRREEQVEGMQRWARRGDAEACRRLIITSGNGESDPAPPHGNNTLLDAREVADACIRCAKGTGEGTMGFFVAGFKREPAGARLGYEGFKADEYRHVSHAVDSDESEFEGFD